MPSATTTPSPALPIFDFSQFRHGGGDLRKQSANEIVDAFKTYGFVYLVNHGISDERVNKLFDWTRKFFDLPEPIRTHPDLLRPEQTPGDDNFVARGYTPTGREKLSQEFDEKVRAVPDVKDMFECGPDGGPGLAREGNRFPPKAALPGFEDFLNSFFWEAHELGLDILRSIGMGLGLAEDYFVEYHQEADNLFRMIRYPSVERRQLREGTTARTSPHTDYGSITILFQDDVGGLEVENPKKPGTYIQATPVPGAVIVNVGDFLMRWTNDVLKSNLHRVVEPPVESQLDNGMELTRERFSIPYFVQGDRNKVIKCLEGLEGDGAKYEPISALDYLNMRVTASFKRS